MLKLGNSPEQEGYSLRPIATKRKKKWLWYYYNPHKAPLSGPCPSRRMAVRAGQRVLQTKK